MAAMSTRQTAAQTVTPTWAFVCWPSQPAARYDSPAAATDTHPARLKIRPRSDDSVTRAKVACSGTMNAWSVPEAKKRIATAQIGG